MANYLTTDTELTSIADAIRTKGGTTADLVYPTGFVSAINNIPTGGGGTVNLTGDCSYAFYGNAGEQMVDNITFTTSDITETLWMFNRYSRTTIPFDLNFAADASLSFQNMFYQCRNLTVLPAFNYHGAKITSTGFNGMFQNCQNLQNIPDFLDGADLTDFYSGTSNNKFRYMFSGCTDLIAISPSLLGKLYSNTNSTSRYSYTFSYCYSLKAINNFAAFGNNTTTVVSTNIFDRHIFTTLSSCSSITFSCNGDIRLYSNQSIYLDGDEFGYNPNSYISGYNYFTGGRTLQDSVYDHDSLVETIASLPDTSSVSPPENPNNIITLKNNMGSNSANGGVNDLTAEEIAVATNKGWSLVYVD